MSDTRMDRVTKIFAATDAQDVPAIMDLCADDITAFFGNSEAMVGRDQVHEGVAAFHQSVAGLKHTILKTWFDDTDSVVEATATYDRLDGKQVTLPVVAIMSHNEAGKITSYRVYFDIAPVYAP